MTIKEIEEASGMQRANIRFYEAEGFLNPEREKNGYRNYTEEDLKILKKIKLLRSLHISLEEIKAMHNGEQNLNKTLEEHIATLIKQQEDLGKSKYVCEKMRQDGATYETLDTEQYLQVLRTCRPENTECEEWVERDKPEPVRAPFSRIFARGFDYVFYMLLWIILVFFWHRLTGLSRTGIIFSIALSVPMVLPLALLLEPLFLCLFGATPGKWLLGLRVTYELGGRIPKSAAWTRTWRAVCMLHDWQYREAFQLVRIFEAMDAGKLLDWDYMANTTIELKDDKCRRRVALAIVTVLCVFGMKFTCCAMEMLPNRGDVTAAEFAENYNARMKLEGRGGTKITEDGEWEGKSSYSSGNRGYFTMTINGESHRFIDGNGPKKIDIKTENDIVTEAGFFYETTNEEEYLSMYQNLMVDIAMTFIEAEENYSVFTYKYWPETRLRINGAIGYDALAHANQSAHFDDFSYRIGEVVISCDVELKGYELWNDRYVAKKGEDTYYSIRFSVKKAEKAE